jgi:hypothetical protein
MSEGKRRSFLDCGVLTNGFPRVHGALCWKDRVVPSSGKVLLNFAPVVWRAANVSKQKHTYKCCHEKEDCRRCDVPRTYQYRFQEGGPPSLLVHSLERKEQV